jgi:8-hydroxy-5-deazaflavin:NADPH oxidoreductase
VKDQQTRKRALTASSISIIGTGHMARILGTLAVEGGNAIEVTGRDPAKAAGLADALGRGATAGTMGPAPAGDIVILAVLYDSAAPVVSQYGDALAGKVIVDISNPFNPSATGLATRPATGGLDNAAVPRRRRPSGAGIRP